MASESRRRPIARLFATTRVNRRVCAAVAPISKDFPSKPWFLSTQFTCLALWPLPRCLTLCPCPSKNPRTQDARKWIWSSPPHFEDPFGTIAPASFALRVEVAKSNRTAQQKDVFGAIFNRAAYFTAQSTKTSSGSASEVGSPFPHYFPASRCSKKAVCR